MAIGNLLGTLTPEEIEIADEMAREFVKGMLGHTFSVAGVAVAIAAEFVLRHNVLDLDDLIRTINTVAEYKDEKGLGGSIGSAPKDKASN